MLNLSISLRVGDGGIVNTDATILCLALELDGYEGGTQVREDPIGHTKAMHDVLYELDCLG